MTSLIIHRKALPLASRRVRKRRKSGGRIRTGLDAAKDERKKVTSIGRASDPGVCKKMAALPRMHRRREHLMS